MGSARGLTWAQTPAARVCEEVGSQCRVPSRGESHTHAHAPSLCHPRWTASDTACRGADTQAAQLPTLGAEKVVLTPVRRGPI